MAGENKLLLAEDRARCVDPGDNPLHRRLLIARRTVELPRAVQPGDVLEFECVAKLERIHAVVLDRVGKAHDLCGLEAADRGEHFILDVVWHA